MPSGRGANVLILCSDEHARSMAGCYGHPIVRTPTLDRLARGGTRFANAYTPSPICIPARACLATGLPLHETRCWSSAEPYRGQIESWMHRLRRQGHAAVSIGKLHFRSADDDNGFSESLLPMYLANDGLGWPQGLIRDPLPSFPEARELAEGIGPGETDYTDYDRRITAEVCRWLGRYPARITDRPWALFVSFVSPHYPLVSPKSFWDLYAGVPIDPPFGNAPGERPVHDVLAQVADFWNYDDYFDGQKRLDARRAYYGLVSFMDDNCRQVLEALDSSGASRDTIVLYISDHGEMLGNLGFWTKSVMYEDSSGIPLIASGPGVPTAVNRTPVSLIDIAATVEMATGAGHEPAREAWRGRPLQDLMASPEPGRIVISEYHDGGCPVGMTMLRHHDWKYVHYSGGHAPQLFDLGSDPRELRDLGRDPRHAADLARLGGMLRQLMDPDAVAAEAFADQRRIIDRLGGREKVLAMRSFNHTPVE